MKNVPENELFSAYLDGELTAAEQAQMERLLETSPAARQLLEEFKALSSTLQSLPLRKLDEDLTERVLRQAERQMLSESPEPPSAHDPLQAEPGRWDWPSIRRRFLQRRTLFWPAAAVAVAVLLAVFNRNAQERPDAARVALAPPARGPRTPAEPLSIAAAREDSGAMGHIAGKDERTAGRGAAADSAPADRAERKAATTSPEPLAMKAIPASQPMATPTPAPATMASEEAPARAPGMTPTTLPRIAVPAKPKEDAESKPSVGAMAKSSPGKGNAFGDGMDYGAARMKNGISRTRVSGAKSGPQPSKAGFPIDEYLAGEAGGTGTLIVRCDVSTEATARDLLQQAFARQPGLAATETFERNKDRPAGAAGMGAYGAAEVPRADLKRRPGLNRPDSGQIPQEVQSSVAKKATPPSQQKTEAPSEPVAGPMAEKPVAAVVRDLRQGAAQAATSPQRREAQVYWEVEATPDQLRAALAALRARRDVFSAFSFESGRNLQENAYRLPEDSFGGRNQLPGMPGNPPLQSLQGKAGQSVNMQAGGAFAAKQPAAPSAGAQNAQMPGGAMTQQAESLHETQDSDRGVAGQTGQKALAEESERASASRNVLFVLRLVPASEPVSAELAVEKAKAAKAAARLEAVPAAAAAPRLPAAMPAVAPPAAK